MNKSLLKWSPTVAIRKPDNLISSHTKPPFKASYENNPKEDMNFLMSNEYMRIWFQEKLKYEKDTYTREQIIKEESKIKRRIIQRMMTYRKPTKNWFIDDLAIRKGGQNKSTKTQDRSKEQEKMKYKPACSNRAGTSVKVKSKSKRLNSITSKVNKTENEDSDECDNNEIILCPCKEDEKIC